MTADEKEATASRQSWCSVLLGLGLLAAVAGGNACSGGSSPGRSTDAAAATGTGGASGSGGSAVDGLSDSSGSGGSTDAASAGDSGVPAGCGMFDGRTNVTAPGVCIEYYGQADSSFLVSGHCTTDNVKCSCWVVKSGGLCSLEVSYLPNGIDCTTVVGCQPASGNKN